MESIGLLITEVAENSPAQAAGVEAGERLLALNGRRIRDRIDFLLAAGEERSSLRLQDAAGRRRSLVVKRGAGEGLGIALAPEAFVPCTCRCPFCFVAQNPPGLRRSLYLKDDDYRLSFLQGNYITGTRLGPRELARIRALRLSPLYLSIHSLDSAKRARLFGRKDCPPVKRLLERLCRDGVELHLQVVVCPGINDGPDLEDTLRALLRVGEGVRSVGVVPVGLTRHHRHGLRRPSAAQASSIVRRVRALEKESRQARGENIIYLADEFFLLSGQAIPGRAYYGAYPQWENGVGMVRHFQDGVKAGRHGAWRGGGAVAVSGSAMAPLLRRLARGPLVGAGLEVLEVSNRLFGPQVGVSGLLPGRAVAGAAGRLAGRKPLLLPDNCLTAEGEFVDGYRLSQLRASLRRPLYVLSSSEGGQLPAFLHNGKIPDNVYNREA